MIPFYCRFLLWAVLAFLDPTAASFATPWSELEPKTLIRLKQNLLLEEGWTFPRGAIFALDRIDSIGAIGVETLSLRHIACPPELAEKKASLQMIGDRYGVEMDLNCEMTLYLELKDHWQESLFEAPAP